MAQHHTADGHTGLAAVLLYSTPIALGQVFIPKIGTYTLRGWGGVGGGWMGGVGMSWLKGELVVGGCIQKTIVQARHNHYN
jgi:hypothetical protein